MIVFLRLKITPIISYIHIIHQYDKKIFLFSVFNLSNQIDVESTRKMIDQYKKENKEQIKKNNTKVVRLVCILQSFLKVVF